jgi:hypothetical protein
VNRWSSADDPSNGAVTDYNGDGFKDLFIPFRGTTRIGEVLKGQSIQGHRPIFNSFEPDIFGTDRIDPGCTGIVFADFNNDGYSDFYAPNVGGHQLFKFNPVQNSQKTVEVLRLTPPGKVEHPTLHGEPEHPEFVESDLSSGKVSASPNPFNPNTTIHFDLPEGCPAKVAVFDIRGMLVRDLVNESLEAGHHSIPWNGRDNSGRLLASGRYIVHVQAGRLQTTTPVVLVK